MFYNIIDCQNIIEALNYHFLSSVRFQTPVASCQNLMTFVLYTVFLFMLFSMYKPESYKCKDYIHLFKVTLLNMK